MRKKSRKPRNRSPKQRNQIHTKTKIMPAPLTPLKILGLPLSAVRDDVEASKRDLEVRWNKGTPVQISLGTIHTKGGLR